MMNLKLSKRSAVVVSMLIASSVGAFFVGRAFAGGIPGTGALTYAGTLEDAMGAPLTGGPYNVEVKLWSALSAGTELCTTGSMSVTLMNGRFSLTLPDDCTAQIQDNSDAAAEVLVDGQSLGRAKLGAVPYAVEALHAVSADSAATATMATSATSATSAMTATNAEMATGALATTISDLAAAVATPDATKVILNTTTQQTADFAIAGNGRVGRLGVGLGTMMGANAKFEVYDDGQVDPADLSVHHTVIGHVANTNPAWEGDGICARGAAGAAMCMGFNSDNAYWGHQEANGPVTRMTLYGATGNLEITGMLTQASSQALKKDITYLDDAGLDKALAYVNDTPVATYRYKTMAEGTKPVYGVIAEQTPTALLAQDDKAVNISTTVGVLLASIKAQQRHIKQLEDRIQKLEQAR